MEIAGGTIGILTLASLFNTCLTTLDILHSAANYGQTLTHLAIKIEVEKIRLMIWGDSIGLTSLSLDPGAKEEDVDLDELDEALQRPRLRGAVVGLLISFATVLEDVEGLSKRYGMAPVKEPANPAFPSSSSSSLLTSTFRRTYALFKDYSSTHQTQTSKATIARFAILDEKKFRSLVSELRAINDSLSSLLPAIQQKVRVQMRKEIMASSDMEQLEKIVDAGQEEGEGVGDLVVETASLRLEMLSSASGGAGRRHETRVVVVESDVPASAPTFTPAPNTALAPRPRPQSAAPTPLTPSPPSPQPRRVSAMPDSVPQSMAPSAGGLPPMVAPSEPPYDDTGSLAVHKLLLEQSILVPSWLNGVESASELQVVNKPAHPAFESLWVPKNLEPLAHRPMSIEPESYFDFYGSLPGTISLPGFTHEYSFWYQTTNQISQTEKKWFGSFATPSLPYERILSRWKIVKNGLPKDWTEKKGFEEIREFVGETTGFTWIDPEEKWKIRHQVEDILMTMGRSPTPSFDREASVGIVVHNHLIPLPPGQEAEFGFADVLLQLYLAREAFLRIEKLPGKRWKWGGITDKIALDFIISAAWAKNMEIADSEFVIGKDLMDRQLLGLKHLINELSWPYYSETLRRIEEMLKSKPMDLKMDLPTWNFLSGLLLPGSMHALGLITVLYDCTPSAKEHFGAATIKIRKGNWGLVFPNLAYWGARSVLGRVLAPMKGVKSIGGLVGPCMRVNGVDKTEYGRIVEIKTRSPPFTLTDTTKGADPSSASTSQNSNVFRIPTSALQPSTASSDWELPRPLSPSTSRVTISSIDFTDQGPREEGEHYAAIFQARINFVIDGMPVSKTLYTNSLFISAPACRGGPHRIPRTSPAAKFYARRRVLELKDLGNAELETETLTVVNACSSMDDEGRAEVYARAWCCHVGSNAVVWKKDLEGGRGGCFKCAMYLAGREGLEVGVVIVC